MKTKSWEVSDVKQLPQVVKEMLEHCGTELFFVFYGEMGSGKTTLISALCACLGTDDAVASPTYAVVNEYALPETSSHSRIYHMDLYRLESLDEAYDIGIEDYLTDDDAVFCIEWPELIEPLLPEHFVKVHLEKVSQSSRVINMQVV